MKIVILSEAKDLLSLASAIRQVFRFAQDDNQDSGREWRATTLIFPQLLKRPRRALFR